MPIRVLLIAMVLFCGCGKASSLKLVPVSGSVKYKGANIEGALVTFVGTGSPRSSVGVTDSSGRFQLTTMNTNDGAVAGENLVTIVKMPPKAPAGQAKTPMQSPEDYMKAMQGSKTGKPPGSDQDTKGAIPAKYSDPNSSGLKRTVVAGEKNEFNFDLTD